MTREDWLECHGYLRPLAAVNLQLETVTADHSVSCATVPNWEDYRSDYRAGVPLLHSSVRVIGLQAAGEAVVDLVLRVSSLPLPEELARDFRGLASELRQQPEAAQRAVAGMIGQEALDTRYPGLFRYLGWTAIARCLVPVLEAFRNWRDEEHWLRSYCPICGSRPAMAQLVGTDPGRMRRLLCGCCGTHWQFRRTGCPFCEAQNDHKLAVVAVEGEAGLRIDYCESCRGYLKTYEGEGDEGVLLADWTSLHLDILARERGLKRFAASLYDL